MLEAESSKECLVIFLHGISGSEVLWGKPSAV